MPVFTSKGVKLEYRDLGLKKLMANIARARGFELRVGIVGAKAQDRTPDGRLSLAELAVIQTEGLAGPPGAPPRDFMNAPFRRAQPRLMNTLRRSSVAIFNGAPVEIALDAAGFELQDIPREAIMDHQVPPSNAKATIAKKGFDHPLVDTLTLFDAISHRVVRDVAGAAPDYESFEIEMGGD